MTRVDEILAGMTLREKVGQLNQRLYGWESVRRTPRGWELTDTFLSELERWSGMGALYGLFRADAWSGMHWANGIHPEDRAEVAALVQSAVTAGSRQGTGVLLSEEAPHGHQALGAPLLPVNLAVGATWNPALLEEASAAVAASLRAQGVHLALVSTLDVLRDARWGRSEECFAESPELAVAMTRAVVRGMQGADRSRLHDSSGVGVVLKHFAAQGDGMGGRNGQTASLGMRELRETHLRAARAGVREGAVSVMAAYTDIDGVPCVADRELLTGILRGEWGFDGVVMADGKSVDRIIRQLGTPRAAAAAAVTAGVDLSLWDESYAHLEEAAHASETVAAAVTRACRRVLALKEHFGLLAPPSAPAERGEVYAAAVDTVRASSAEIAAQSVVLLKNADALPARSDARRWVVIGPNAEEPTALLGDYVSPIGPEGVPSVAAEIRRAGEARGVRVITLPPAALTAGLLTSAARDEVAGADHVFAVLGGTSHRGDGDTFADNGAAVSAADADAGEGVDRASLELPHAQDESVRALRAATTAPLTAIVIAGRPYVLTGLADQADAVLFCAYPGPSGGRAIADIVTGVRQPVGRLAASLPAATGVTPLHDDDRHAADGIYHDASEPLFARIGAGCGYARVSSSDVAHTADAAGVVFTVRLAHVPTSSAWRGDASELVRVLVERRGSVVVPRRSELVSFERVTLSPGETTHLRIAVTSDRLFVPPAERAPFATVTTSVDVVVGDTIHRIELQPRTPS